MVLGAFGGATLSALEMSQPGHRLTVVLLLCCCCGHTLACAAHVPAMQIKQANGSRHPCAAEPPVIHHRQGTLEHAIACGCPVCVGGSGEVAGVVPYNVKHSLLNCTNIARTSMSYVWDPKRATEWGTVLRNDAVLLHALTD